MRIALGLIHWPILDSRKNIVATNVTNLDVHDIARAARVYGIERYYIIHPMQDQLMFVSRLLEHWRIGDGAKYNAMRRTALTMVHTAPSLEGAIQDWGGDPYVISTHARPLEGVPAIGFGDLRDRIMKTRGRDHRGAPLETESAATPTAAQESVGLAEGAPLGALGRVRPLSGLEKNANQRVLTTAAARDGLQERLGEEAVQQNEEQIFLCFGTGFGLTQEMMRACDYLLEPIRGASEDDYRHLSVRSAVSICLDRLLGPW